MDQKRDTAAAAAAAASMTKEAAASSTKKVARAVAATTDDKEMTDYSHTRSQLQQVASSHVRLQRQKQGSDDDDDDDDDDDNDPTVNKGTVPTDPVCCSTSKVARTKTLYTDPKTGNQKLFPSTLGLLTRKFMDLVQSSSSGVVDIHDAAKVLGQPKRRMYDITNVLEGIGIIGKRGKNSVAWLGSESMSEEGEGGLVDAKSKEHIDQLRLEIGAIQKEEAMIDRWMAYLHQKSIFTTTNNKKKTAVHVHDIVQAMIHPPTGSSSSFCQAPVTTTRQELLWEDNQGKPECGGLMVVKAPLGSVACILPNPKGGPERQLFVGSPAGADRYPVELREDPVVRLTHETGARIQRKRKRVFYLSPPPSPSFAYDSGSSNHGGKQPRSAEQVKVYFVPTYYDESSKTVQTTGLQEVVVDDSSRWYAIAPQVEAANHAQAGGTTRTAVGDAEPKVYGPSDLFDTGAKETNF